MLTPLRSVLCISLLAASTFPPVAFVSAQAPTEHVDPAARTAFEQGRDAYDRGRFAEALEAFERAYALSASPKLLFNIGRAAEADLQHERALAAYESYLLALPHAENREFVEARLAKLRELSAQQRPAPAAAAPAARRAPAPTPRPTPAPLAPAPLASAPPRQDASKSVRTTRSTAPGPRLYAGLRTAVGGWISADEYSAKLAMTPGLQIGGEYAFLHFAIGGELRISWFSADGDDDSSRVIDLVVKPRGGYTFPNLPLEVYGTLPFGLSIPESSFETKSGYTVGFLAGATYFFTPMFGLSAETGWLRHHFPAADDGYEFGSLDLTLNQFNLLSLNATLAFGNGE